jgi:hypothetical protein
VKVIDGKHIILVTFTIPSDKSNQSIIAKRRSSKNTQLWKFSVPKSFGFLCFSRNFQYFQPETSIFLNSKLWIFIDQTLTVVLADKRLSNRRKLQNGSWEFQKFASVQSLDIAFLVRSNSLYGEFKEAKMIFESWKTIRQLKLSKSPLWNSKMFESES